MERLILVAHVDAYTGYGVNACHKFLGLRSLGYDVYVRAITCSESNEAPIPHDLRMRRILAPQPEPWEIVISPPPFAKTIGKKTLLITTFESSTLSLQALQTLNQMDAIVVPCEANRETALRFGVKAPIFVCPESVDTKVFHYQQPHDDPVFVFGAAGATGNSGRKRKSLDDVVKAFRLAFPNEPNAALRLKVTPAGPVDTQCDARVRIEHGIRSRANLVDWFSKINVFVSATRYEAWGRLHHEAMACGRPIISPLHSGLCEFFDQKTGWPVESRLVRAEDNQPGDWYRCDVWSMVHRMRQAFENREEVISKGRRASVVATQFDMAHEARRLEAILKELGIVSGTRKRAISKRGSDEDKIIRFYKDAPLYPKMDLPPGTEQKNVTNGPKGLGDLLILTPLPKLFAENKRPNKVFSSGRYFEPLMERNPFYKRWTPSNLLEVDRMHRLYKTGNGHFIQRIQRAFQLPVDRRPKGFLKHPNQKVRGRVVFHFEPGHHSKWQSKHIHPLARQIYPETAHGLQQFVDAHPEMEFFEIGERFTKTVEGVIDHTNLPLCETIKLLSSAEYFVGIISGPMHLATALDCKCVVLINFPDPNQIFLPTLKDIPLVESEWFYPQNVHLHQEGEGPQVKRFSLRNLERAFDGQVYPYWSEEFLHLIDA